MFKNIDHIAIAVHSIEDASKLYTEVYGMKLSAVERIEEQGVNVAFLTLGDSTIELLEPLNLESPVAKFLKKKGEGVHHIAFGCNSIEDARAHALDNDIRLLSDTPRVGAGGKLISFAHPKDTGGILFEFTQKPKLT